MSEGAGMAIETVYPKSPPDDIVDLLFRLQYDARMGVAELRWAANLLHNMAWHRQPGDCPCMSQGFRLGNGCTEKMEHSQPWLVSPEADAEATQLIGEMIAARPDFRRSVAYSAALLSR